MNLSALGLVALAMSPPLGTELREDGFSLRPPSGFTLVRLDAFRGTRAGAVGVPLAGRALSAALVDGDGPDAAALLIAWEEGSFDAHPAARDELSGTVMRHFAEELGMPLALETARAVGGPARRIEVLGTIQQEGQSRHVLVAVMAGDARHAVATFSVPSGRYEALAPTFAASLDSFRVEAAASTPFSRGLAGAVAGGIAGALLVSAALWRRRRAEKQRD